MPEFQTVLYYKKRISIGGDILPSIDNMISKSKYDELDSDSLDKLLDEYSEKKKNYVKGIEKLVDTWVLVNDEDFLETISEVESNDNFVEWNELSKKIIDRELINANL